MKHFVRIMLIITSSYLVSINAFAQVSWNQWKAELRQEAIEDGISPELFDEVFVGINQPDRKTLNLDKRQPEQRLKYLKYRNTRGDAYRIQLGQKKYRKHKQVLNQIGDEYGVDPCIITALWGIESSYGHFLGNFPVIKSLATLAYNPRRAEFFRKELLYALHILQEGHIKNENFKGEWAGASGQPQFLPSSWHRYAVDYNGDGYRNIWTNYEDAFASIANYLDKNGWVTGQPAYVEVNLPYGFDTSLLGKETKMPISEWERLGVRPSTNQPFPVENYNASILEPYGGPYLMAFDNFRVIMRYNNSNYYAGTVWYIADSICKRR